MSGSIFARVRMIAFLGFLLSPLALTSASQAKAAATNPITSNKLQQMRDSALPLPNPRLAPKFGKVAVDTGNSQSPAPTFRTQPLANPTTVLNYRGFTAAPYVSASPSGDPSQVFTSVSADFDRKNGPDVATVEFNGTLNILFNNGKGNPTSSYSNHSAGTLQPGIAYIRQADLNGDGYADVVAMDATNSAFLVFLNKKDGTFSDAVSTAVTPSSGALFQNGGGMIVGDVNGDGKMDVITVANLQTGTFPTYSTVFSQQTFLGNGDGTFQAPTTVDTTLQGFLYVQFGDGLALADLNGDSKLDLVLEVAQLDRIISTTIEEQIGDGKGGFQSVKKTGASVAVDGPPQSTLQVLDLNGDGFQDAVFVTRDGSIYVALGKGDGSLLNPAAPVLANLLGASLLGLADFDKDGKQDLLVFGYGQVGIFAGKGDGTFSPTALGQYSGSLGGDQQPAPADYNGDGNLDFVWVESVYNKASFYFNRGDGTFAGSNAIRPANASSQIPNSTEWATNSLVAEVGDFNGDGKTDVLSYDFTNAAASGFADIDFGISDGQGNFNFTVAMPGTQVGTNQIVSIVTPSVDFNGDGLSDVIFVTQNGLITALANSDGTLQTPVPITFPVPVGCAPINYLDAADVNNDGHVDMVAGYAQNPNCQGSANTPTGIFVFLGDGTGHFNVTFTQFGGALYFSKLVDFNGDGKLDVAIADLNGVGGQYNFYVIPGNGDGTFNTASAKTVVTQEIVSGIVNGDFNNDGKQDLTLLSAGHFDSNGNPIPGTQGALLLPGNGDFTFGNSTLVAKGIYALTGAYGDFNGDGNLDLAISQYASYQNPVTNFGLIILPGQGQGKFGAASNYLLPQFSGVGNASTFLGDFNADGIPDLVVGGGGASALFLNRAGH
ncbi:MAG TPA: VCBS repeat-containing protein [Terriglobales bacterium]|nr:VCBS repeat-containing protein [Terriglobales bacterium]